jgi:hypothetical protein
MLQPPITRVSRYVVASRAEESSLLGRLKQTRPQNPNAARLGPGGAFFVAKAIFTAQ